MKTKQSVKLISATPLWLVANAIRYSHDNHDKSDTTEYNTCLKCDSQMKTYYTKGFCISRCVECGYDQAGDTPIGSNDFDLIKRVGFKFKHESVLEHSMLVFDIECSRAVLQELSRQRHISLTVKSTRYTLKELKNEKPFAKLNGNITKEQYSRASKYVVLTDDEMVNEMIIRGLDNLLFLIKQNKSNDIAKYALPEAFKTRLQLSVNLRELIHIIRLRIAKDALWEFREISKQIIDSLPDDYRELVLLDEKIRENYENFA